MATQRTHHRKKILVVEDETPILAALVATFRREGLEVYAAKNGVEGVAAALEHEPDIIVLDIMMPKMDGITMLGHIRSEGGAWGKRTKALVYTNSNYEEKCKDALRAGISDFLMKTDVSLEDVVKRVHEELDMIA